ncbi:hypothetical protein PENFLA_c043G08195 [Penicillium flavigenum]|uniref:chitinase n=1 Tax=Penicillium flavigenum TaxID=254877 RepID=A0A1V6SIV0_9EURO|nr:hypothetical protein PENFLA_c043G08195 [Penicillium flavigenum]
MPSSGRRSRGQTCLRLLLFVLLGLFALFASFILWTHTSRDAPAPLVESPPLLEDAYDLPFLIDSDTWALQHSNRSELRRRGDINQPQTYYCKKGKPCSNGACCGESGVCGFGTTYCGTGCTSNCDAKAECGKDSKSGHATCPLNVCCSQFGFCGTTDDFCSTGCQSNCRTPSSGGSGGDVRKDITAYYESWRVDDFSSYQVKIQDMPIDAVNGVNFAFASIQPTTYKIIPMKKGSFDQFAEVADVKRKNPDAKVWVSIGGWDFSNNGTSTQPLFGEIASSVKSRALFADNLYKFMIQYGFDGVDVDWEYPGAGDRGGSEDDVHNFPLLLQMIRSRFKAASKNFGISITAPTSYWYLRWFDISAIADAVDFINFYQSGYDLHGVWDAHDPYGSHIYAHTNLTEIEQSLQLLWRNNIDPAKVNLGLAFYGRSFELKDPSCIHAGCEFKGAGAAGDSTNTAGILSYFEIQDIISIGLSEGSNSIVQMYDPEAAVNYLIYDQGKSWVSYDDKRTFQQKIDFANSQGLNGLFIWAIDMDDISYTALKAVTGKDLAPVIGQSATLDYFNIDKCFTTPCGTDCAEGFTTMTTLNRKDNGNSCPSKQTRNYCCPPWGAPNPDKCHWRGSPGTCFGQCEPGEVLLTTDQCGGGSCCGSGVKAYCCPATNGAAAVEACTTNFFGCPSKKPQKLGTIEGWAGKNNICCPKSPEFENCAWHGSSFTCSGNRCPAGQIEITRSKGGDGSALGSCILGRQKVFCCDPPFNGTAFLPVPLDNLFPEDLPAADAPIYYEAFDHAQEQQENPLWQDQYTDDPNKEPFAWTIMVGAEADVQSLRKRDGSHLQTFDCPSPLPEDYSTQTFRAVCERESDDNNCEDLMIGSVRGTIIRLPEECGPDEWVRAVSFKEIENDRLPSHLSKRLHNNPKTYEIKYDYNLRNLRRDGGEVHVRFDASVHPGYWDEIVSSTPSGSKKKRSPTEWREIHMDWFEHRLNKRGYGTSDSWWLDRFNVLLDSHSDYGVKKQFHFQQYLYNSAKSCGSGSAQVSALIAGDLSVRVDYGISMIGTLRNFDFSEAYAYFNLHNLHVDTMAEIKANAVFRYESQVLQLLDRWDVFEGTFNIKGLWSIGPYFDATAQIQGLATISGTMRSGMSFNTEANGDRFTYMFPQSLNKFPSASVIKPNIGTTEITAAQKASISADGSLTLTMTPSLGFQIDLDVFGEKLIDSRVSAAFQNAMTVRVGAGGSTSGDLCNGAHYGIDYSLDVSIGVENPIPGWSSGAHSINIYGVDKELLPTKCYPWAKDVSKREMSPAIDSNETMRLSLNGGLSKRTDEMSTAILFPDVYGSALGCATNTDTDSGDCNKAVPGWTDGSFADISEANLIPNDITDTLTDYGEISAPPSSESKKWATEHVLEWQLFVDFWEDYTEGNGAQFQNPLKTTSEDIGVCQYIKYWWDTKYMDLGSLTGRPIDLVAYAFPSSTSFRDELMLIDSTTNGAKLAIWGDQSIRSDAKMWSYLNGDGDDDYNTAINVCKHVIFAMKYVVEPQVSSVLVKQAARVGQYFDDMEKVLENYNDPNWNKHSYKKLNLGNQWRSFMYQQWPLAVNKQKSFLDKWVSDIEKFFQPDSDDEDAMDGVETNQDVLDRIDALKTAYAAMPALPNPFPSSWQ